MLAYFDVVMAVERLMIIHHLRLYFVLQVGVVGRLRMPFPSYQATSVNFYYHHK